MLEQLELALTRALTLVELGQLRPQPRHLRAARRASPEARGVLGAAQAVEQLELGGGNRELAMLVLPVEANESGADLPHLAHGDRAPVQVRARAAIRAHPPGQHQLLGAWREPLADARLERRLTLLQSEDALHVRLLSARPHDARARATPQQQIERVSEHRLAGPGLAREHVQARRQAQLGLLYQQQVLDAQLAQHRAIPSSAPRRSARRRATLSARAGALACGLRCG